MHEELHNFY